LRTLRLASERGAKSGDGAVEAAAIAIPGQEHRERGVAKRWPAPRVEQARV
jgi:hypothetical protein